ncbi:MAG: cysteine synthase family protein [Clostridia bacterium]|nr:cysteine synthase family protein [Clostridia bacterium]
MNIVKLIGNTPMIELTGMGKSRVFAKLEYYNPTGSIKDRAAYYMIKEAVLRGDVKSGGTIVEPTSGNTGIGLAMVARAYGIKAVIVMPSNMSKERIDMMKAYGASVILTDAKLGMQGAVDRAKEIVAEKGAYMPSQFDNPDNALAHYETTAPEIFNVNSGVKWVISPLGSGGTAMGIKKYIEDNGMDAKVCALEPTDSPMLSKGVSGAHKIQGIGANFMPSIVDLKKLDKIMGITNDEAYYGARELASKYGILAGISAGSAYVGAIKLMREEDGDIAIIIPDSGTRYMSAGLYE